MFDWDSDSMGSEAYYDGICNQAFNAYNEPEDSEAYQQYELAQRQLIHPEKFWKTANGKIIPVASMELAHLQNTVSLLERKNFTQHPAYGEMKKRIERIIKGVEK